MLFHSLTFWCFFTVIFALYWRLPLRGQNLLLILASNFFYGWWDWRFLPLMWFPIVMDYHVGKRLSICQDARRRKAWLMLSLSGNLGVLFFFKYLRFAVGEICRLLGWVGVSAEVPSWVDGIILPIALSFHTFQTLSYVVDVYRRRTAPVKSFEHYTLYCSFFPQLLAGPIERPSALLPQLLKPRERLTSEQFTEGLYHLITGFFKKMVIADNMAVLVNHLFAKPVEQLTFWEVLLASYAFAFQIYGDFSGYSSMAQGIARWLGVELMWNFKQPYLATSPQMFWQRWHISLSTWLRDYLFMPLMGLKRLTGMTKVYVVTLIVQTLCGVWHGANWTFVFWGLLHGGYLCLQLFLTRQGSFKEPPPDSSLYTRLPYIVGTFHLMCVGMILFRANGIGQAWDFFASAFSSFQFTPLAAYGLTQMTILVLPWMTFECWLEQRKDSLALLKISWPVRTLVYACMFLMIWFLPPENTNEFIYFQF